MEVMLPDPSLVILCGPAGCGKSTFARKHFVETAVVSSDRCRGLIADDEQDLRVSAAAFVLFHQIIDSRLHFRRLSVADSTALHPDARRDLRRIAGRWGAPTALLAFDIPEETCVLWNARRKRRVERAVIHRQRRQLDEALRAVMREGYDQVVVLGPADVEHGTVRIGG
jgi:protein phosphatase